MGGRGARESGSFRRLTAQDFRHRACKRVNQT